tara:strand:+ start:1143 stop:1541 length:399 start_codon:yes stop_codon:yes gene_type:complete
MLGDTLRFLIPEGVRIVVRNSGWIFGECLLLEPLRNMIKYYIEDTSGMRYILHPDQPQTEKATILFGTSGFTSNPNKALTFDTWEEGNKYVTDNHRLGFTIQAHDFRLVNYKDTDFLIDEFNKDIVRGPEYD